MKKSSTFNSWDKFLNPESLKQSFLEAAIFIAAYEFFEDRIIDLPKTFFSNYENGQSVSGPDYHEEVRRLHDKPFNASLLWFMKMGAIDKDDYESVMRLRDRRNYVVHKLLEFVSTDGKSIEPENYHELHRIISKVDRWWIREIEIPTNPDFTTNDYDSIVDDEIQSGNMMIFQIIFSIIDNPNFLEELYKQFNEKLKANNRTTQQEQIPD